MKLLLLVLVFNLPVFAQDAQPDRWRTLILNESSVDDVTRVLGKPVKDKTDKLLAFRIQPWLTRRAKEKIFRVLEFQKPEGIDKARTFFLDNKLVAIELDVKKGISPAGLATIYGIEFQPLVGAADVGFRPRDYERNQGRVYPKSYPVVYAMVGVSENSFITATVGNVPSFAGAFARSAGIPDQPGTFPGRVESVMIISRVLENKDGVDVLK